MNVFKLHSPIEIVITQKENDGSTVSDLKKFSRAILRYAEI